MYYRFRRMKYEYRVLLELHSQKRPMSLGKTVFQRQFFFYNKSYLVWAGFEPQFQR